MRAGVVEELGAAAARASFDESRLGPTPHRGGPDRATLFQYGPDAERLFTAIEGTLRAHPLCQVARVVIRRGGPGAEEREVRL